MSDLDWPVPSNPDRNSRSAAHSLEGGEAATQRAAVLAHIKANGPIATWQVEEAMGGLHQTISARVYDLQRAGLIKRVGYNRTPSGRRAYLLAVAEDPRPAIDESRPWPPHSVPDELNAVYREAPPPDTRPRSPCHNTLVNATPSLFDPRIGEGRCPTCHKVVQVRL